MKSLTSGSSLDNVQKGPVYRTSSLQIAMKFQKIQKFYMRNSSKEAETINGGNFLKSMLRGSGKPADFDDLADFIECKPGKNYSCWFKDREKYLKWKGGKMSVLVWKEKKKAWETIGRKDA